uniref:Glycosyltransferase n=1 Tax=Kalanchoe fedtschenkoi TaxID=63787 RepID=A0A7N0ZTX8_KALFE
METVLNKQQHQLHIAMFPFFAFGHIKPYMNLSNKLAERGHRVAFFLPPKTQPVISELNSHPELITLIPVPLPQVPGLDPNIQTTSDCDFSTQHLLATAFDRTASFIESSLHSLKPHAAFYDFAYWLPEIARRMGVLAVHFCIVGAANLASLSAPTEKEELETQLPRDFPHPCVALKKFEVRNYSNKPHGEGVTIMERLRLQFKHADAIAVRTCRELEGHYLDYLEKQCNKPVLTTGLALTEPGGSSTPLKERIATWLDKFEPKSVIYCCFGSMCVPPLSQFQELVLGMELTGLPFLIAVKPPKETDSVETALPEGFKRRTGDRGMVTGEWVQQQQILAHRSVGCFVTHCGWGSLGEGLISECQLVLLPQAFEQHTTARVMGQDLGVGVEVEFDEEDGLFDRYGVCKAVKLAMNMEDGVGKEVKNNHDEVRKVLSSPELERSCVDELVVKLKELVSRNNKED